MTAILSSWTEEVLSPGIMIPIGNSQLFWEVLEIDQEANTILMIAGESVCYKQYNENNGNVTWENCSLRKWLNDDYFNSEFSQDEKDAIVYCDLKNPDNEQYKVEGGNDTRDRVFLLTLEDAEKFILKRNEQYSESWWLRQPGGSPEYAAIVYSYGFGYSIGEYTVFRKTGVRPVIKMSMESAWIQSLISTDDDGTIRIKTPNIIIYEDNRISVSRSAQSIVVPGSVETIPSDVFRNKYNLFDIEISHGTKEICSQAFSGCSGLKSVVLPDSLIKIGDSAFFNCLYIDTIRIPDSVNTIGKECFKQCYQLKDVYLSENIRKIEAYTFNGCTRLEHIELPQNLEEIGEGAFSNCSNLKEVSLSDSLKTVGKNAFKDCNELVLIIPESLAQSREDLSGELARGIIQTTDKGFAYLLLYQKTVLWKNWKNRVKLEHPESILAEMIQIMEKDEMDIKKTAGITADYIRKYRDSLPVDLVRRALSLYEAKMPKQIKELYDDDFFQAYLQGAAIEANPVEEEAQQLISEFGLIQDIDSDVQKGIHYRDSKTICSREVLISVINTYAHIWKKYAIVIHGDISDREMLKNGSVVRINEKADHIAEYLDPVEFSDYLEKMIKGTKYRLYLLSWARFATEDSVERITDLYTRYSKGRAKEMYFAENFREALMISDTREAMKFFDRIEVLEKYAKMRGKTAIELRDISMMPDLGFDMDGIKRFDIGDNYIIEASVNDNLKICLFDTNKQKATRSFPKKGGDSEKAKASAEEYAVFKKRTEEFIRERSEQMMRMHLSGDRIQKDIWQSVYLKHPVISLFTDKLVWMDETETSFIVHDGKIIDSSMSEYEPGKEIHIAHVLELSEEEISKWQHIFTELHIKQAFEQIWEPVLKWDLSKISERYKDVTITAKDRNKLKSDLKRRGINVFSDEMEREFNARAWNYTFSGSTRMHLGHDLLIDYTVDEQTKELTFGKAHVSSEGNQRELNAVLFEMDKTAIQSYIDKDCAEVLSDVMLEQFTAAQIRSFIQTAIDKDAVNCRAVLMNYNDEHYSEYNAIEEFVLDW